MKTMKSSLTVCRTAVLTVLIGSITCDWGVVYQIVLAVVTAVVWGYLALLTDSQTTHKHEGEV